MKKENGIFFISASLCDEISEATAKKKLFFGAAQKNTRRVFSMTFFLEERRKKVIRKTIFATFTLCGKRKLSFSHHSSHRCARVGRRNKVEKVGVNARVGCSRISSPLCNHGQDKENIAILNEPYSFRPTRSELVFQKARNDIIEEEAKRLFGASIICYYANGRSQEGFMMKHKALVFVTSKLTSP